MSISRRSCYTACLLQHSCAHLKLVYVSFIGMSSVEFFLEIFNFIHNAQQPMLTCLMRTYSSFLFFSCGCVFVLMSNVVASKRQWHAWEPKAFIWGHDATSWSMLTSTQPHATTWISTVMTNQWQELRDLPAVHVTVWVLSFSYQTCCVTYMHAAPAVFTRFCHV